MSVSATYVFLSRRQAFGPMCPTLVMLLKAIDPINMLLRRQSVGTSVRWILQEVSTVDNGMQ